MPRVTVVGLHEQQASDAVGQQVLDQCSCAAFIVDTHGSGAVGGILPGAVFIEHCHIAA